MEKNEIKIRVFRETPFAWQSKNILRHIQKNYKGQKLTSRMSVYLALTQIASDLSNEEYETWGVKIMEMSGVGYTTLREIFNEFEEMKIIKRKQVRTKQGTFGKLEIVLLEPKLTDSQSKPNGKPKHKAGHKHASCDSQSKEYSSENKKENNGISLFSEKETEKETFKRDDDDNADNDSDYDPRKEYEEKLEKEMDELFGRH